MFFSPPLRTTWYVQQESVVGGVLRAFLASPMCTDCRRCIVVVVGFLTINIYVGKLLFDAVSLRVFFQERNAN